MDDTIFMMASSKTPIHSYIELAAQLNEEHKFQTVILCDDEGMYEKYIEEVIGKNIVFYAFEQRETDDIVNSDSSLVNNKRKHKNIIAGIRKMCGIIVLRYPHNFVSVFIRTVYHIGVMKRQEKKVREIFEKYVPKALILYSDRRGGYESLVIKIAEEYKIPRLIAPIVTCGNPYSLINNPTNGYRINCNSRTPLACKLIMKYYPNSYIRNNNMYIFYDYPGVTFAKYYMNTLSDNPWIPGGGGSTFIGFVDSKDYGYCKTALGTNWAKEKAKVLRSIEMTSVYRSFQMRNQMKEFYREKYDLDGERIVILALSGYTEARNTFSYNISMSNYIKIIKAAIDVFGSILLSLHPRMNREDYPMFESVQGCRVLEERLYKVISICDVYIGFEISSISAMIKAFSFPKIQISHEQFTRNMSDNEINNLLRNLESVKRENRDIELFDDGNEDFYQIVLDNILSL